MNVDSLSIYKVFSGGGEVHYILPTFQRAYAWDKANWQTLLDDVFHIYEIYDDTNEPEHFMGALVVISDGNRSGTIPAFKLVDGQQRLVTISIALCALGQLTEKSYPSVHRKIRKLLVNEEEGDLIRYKLVPTEKYGDRETYISIIDGKPIANSNSRIGEMFDFFYKQLRGRIHDGSNPERLFLVFANCLQVVFINLDKKERPYEIFESLNAKGKPLTQPDLIRNYIAMMLPEGYQPKAFEAWSKIEDLLREDRTVSRIGELTAFLRHYLGSRTGTLPNKEHVYARFRDETKSTELSPEDFVHKIYILQKNAEIYDKLLRPAHETDVEIRRALERFRILESTTSYPFLLFLFEKYQNGDIDKTNVLEGLRILENYLIRRFMAGESTQYTSKMFPALSRDIDLQNLPQSLRDALLRRNYPTDSRIREQLPSLTLYERQNNNLLEFLLLEINRELSRGSGGYTILDNQATIEHIMPQEPTSKWKSELGETWEEIYRDYLHTIGNLTLVTQEWNSRLSNAPFAEKKIKFAAHALKLNSSYFTDEISVWNAQSIRDRGAKLTKEALSIWKAFGEPPVVLRQQGQRPSALILRGEQYETNTWRDVVICMLEFAIDEKKGDFKKFADGLSSKYITQESRDRAKQLSNGWWIYVNLSRDSVMTLCERIANALGLEDDEWDVKYKLE